MPCMNRSYQGGRSFPSCSSSQQTTACNVAHLSLYTTIDANSPAPISALAFQQEERREQTAQYY